MPAELGDKIGISSDVVGNKQIAFDPKDSAWKILVRRESPKPLPNPDDEYNYHGPILKPQRSVTVEVVETVSGLEVKKLVNLDERLEKEFTYLSATHELEVDTPKTQVLQDSVDRMIEGMEVDPIKVVVMNKGEAPEAFVYADGTMFVSQSLLNALDSVDEIGGVLAHEIGHIINKSTDKKLQAGAASHDLGVGWVHETASDLAHPISFKQSRFK